MEITRNVILDLLPLYLADEASEDSRQLVEQFLAKDPQLAKLVDKTADLPLPDEPPSLLNKETEMKKFEKTKDYLFQRNLFLVMAILFTMLWLGVSIIYTFWENIGVLGFPTFLIAGFFWTAFFNVNGKLEKSE